jgi:hypothetical protein
MNTEPPTGDDLQRMLVSMKRNVLTQAEDRRPAGRGRHTGIVVAVVALLALGTASGAVALAVVPDQQQAAPVASSAPAEPEPTRTASSAPVVEAPDPVVPTPTATASAAPTRPPFAADDPDTWTISGDEVGPVAVGGATEAESDDLEVAYHLLPSGDGTCTAPGTWARDGSPGVQVVSEDGVVTDVLVGSGDGITPDQPGGPTTAAGIGVGSTLDEVRAAYPSLAQRTPGSDAAWSLWSFTEGPGTVRFQVGQDGSHVRVIWAGQHPDLPTAVCDL